LTIWRYADARRSRSARGQNLRPPGPQPKVGPARTSGQRDGLTKAQAERELRRLREADHVAPPSATALVSMQEAGADLRQRLEIKGRKKSHRMTVAADLRNHIVPFFGTRELRTITPDDIERYIVIKKRNGLAIKTIRNHVNTMHSAFEIAVRRGWCPSNPVSSQTDRCSSAPRRGSASSSSQSSNSCCPRRIQMTRSGALSQRSTSRPR
jgi:hypothetical protein